MAIRTIDKTEKILQAYLSLKVGDSILIPFRRYSYNCIKRMASKVKTDSRGHRVLSVSTQGRLTDARVTREK